MIALTTASGLIPCRFATSTAGIVNKGSPAGSLLCLGTKVRCRLRQPSPASVRTEVFSEYLRIKLQCQCV